VNGPIVINHRQMTWLVCTLLVAGGLNTAQKELIRIASIDSYFTYILPVMTSLAVIFLLVFLHKRFPGKHLFDISYELCGSWGGRIINTILVIYMWFSLVHEISRSSSFVEATLLPTTPTEITILCFVLVLMQYGTATVEVPCRINDIFWPIFVLLIFILPIALANEFEFERTRPPFAMAEVNVLLASVVNVGWFGDLIIVGAFMHTIASNRQFAAAVRQGVITSAFLLTLLLFTCLNVLGSHIAAKDMYPTFSILQQINVTDFLDRVDVMVYAVLIPVTIIRMAFMYLAVLIGLQSFLRSSKSSDYRHLNRPLPWLLLFWTIFAYDNVVEIFKVGNYGAPILFPVFCLIPLLMLVGISRFRKSKSDEALIQIEDLTNPDALNRCRSARRWSNVLIALCAAIVVIGGYLGNNNSRIGLFGAILYIICLIGATFMSRIETREAVKLDYAKKHVDENQSMKV
jgi:spore germination protein KB